MVFITINQKDSSIVYQKYHDFMWIRKEKGPDWCDEECGESDYKSYRV
jgi:hypothetical protein